MHEWLAIGMFALLVLHVAGALKHQFVLRDDTIARMLPWRERRGNREKEKRCPIIASFRPSPRLCWSFAGGVAAAEWRVDPAASRLGFFGTQAGSPFEGSFEKFSANIRFDAADLSTSNVVVVIDMASARTGNAERDVALKGQDWFAISPYPQARFETKASGTLAATATRPTQHSPFAMSRSRWCCRLR